MNKLLFVHGHRFYKENEMIYSGGGLPAKTWKNYLTNFDEIIVFGRRSFNTYDKKVVSSHPNVNFFLTKNSSTPFRFIINFHKIKKELSLNIKRVNIVLVRMPSILGIIAGHIAFKNNKKLWIEQVGNGKESLVNHGSLLGKIIAIPVDVINKRIVSKADYITYVTMNKLQKDYPPNSQSITASFSDVIINKVLILEELDKKRFYGEKLKIGLIGGFDVKYKGQDILLKAISLFPDELIKNIEVYFVGKGNPNWIKEYAKKLSLDHIIKYTGSYESGNEINMFLKKLSLYIQPSLTEGMPRAIIEAMSMGCPVIGSNVGGIPDIVNKALIHSKGNVKQLSKHINHLYNNRDLLYNEALHSLRKAEPFLKSNLDKKRYEFYQKINRDIHEKKTY